MVESRKATRGALTTPRPELLSTLSDQHVLATVLHAEAAVSRAEIAAITGLSKPAVSSATARLLARGVLRDVGIRSGKRGGVATLFELNPDHGRSLAVVIQNDVVTVQSRDLRHDVRAEFHTRVTPTTTREQLLTDTRRLIDAVAAVHTSPLLAAAVSIADPYDVTAGTPVALDRSVFPAAAFHPREDLGFTETPRFIADNDVNWAALGEYQHGELHGCANFIYVYVGEGIGAGLIVDGRLVHGRRGFAGEIGYLRATDAGGRTPVDLTERLIELGLGTPDRYALDLGRAAALFGDDSLGDSARCIVEALASAIANTAIVLNPEALALGGPLFQYASFTDALCARIAELSIDPPRFVLSTATPLDGASQVAHHLALTEAGAAMTEDAS